MSIKLYMDYHVPSAITKGLRLAGVEVITAFEDGTSEWSDPNLLDRAIELGCVLFTQDDDFLAEATRRQRAGIEFNGIIYAHQIRVAIGICVRDLELIAKAGNPAEFHNKVEYLPL